MTTATKVEELKATLSDKELSRLNYRLSDAIREGASITAPAKDWGNGEQACALHAAVISARARGYLTD